MLFGPVKGRGVRLCAQEGQIAPLAGTAVPARVARAHLHNLLDGLLLEQGRDGLVGRGAALRVVKLALVAVGAFFAVGAGGRQIGGG